jgi:deoxycytidylate deaminase
MNIRLYNRAVEIAKALKPRAQNGKSFHITCAIVKSRIVCVGVNSYTKMHPYHRFGKYHSHHSEYKDEYRPSLHSEVSMIVKLGEEDLSCYDILNIRINNNGNVSNSNFCPNCFRTITNLNPKSLWYSGANGELLQREIG